MAPRLLTAAATVAALLALAGIGGKAWQYRANNQRLNAEIFKLTFEPGKARIRADYAEQNAEARAVASGRATVLLGDSIARRWGHPDAMIVNRGVGGETTTEIARRVQSDAITLRPRALVLIGGANDLQFAAVGTDCRAVGDQITHNLTGAADAARAAGVRVTIVGMMPAGLPGKPLKGACWPQVRRVNAALRDGAPTHGYRFFDPRPLLADPSAAFRAEFSEHGLHPNAAAFARLTGALG